MTLQEDLAALRRLLPGWRWSIRYRDRSGTRVATITAVAPDHSRRLEVEGQDQFEAISTLVGTAILDLWLPRRVEEAGWEEVPCAGEELHAGNVMLAREVGTVGRAIVWALAPRWPWLWDVEFNLLSEASACLTETGYADAEVRELVVGVDEATDGACFAAAVSARRATPGLRVYINVDEELERRELEQEAQTRRDFEALADLLSIPDELREELYWQYLDGDLFTDDLYFGFDDDQEHPQDRALEIRRWILRHAKPM
jgi:hypothetical protein